MATRNSSISSSERDWKRFSTLFLGVFLGGIGGLYLFILLVDPYDSLPFSLPFERVAVSSDDRLFKPGLARKPIYDSAIIGNSYILLLKPDEMNPLFRASFVNLGLRNTTAPEQFEILDLFLRHHPVPRLLLFGMEPSWCRPGKAGKPSTRKLEKGFPAWLFDENPWNDLPALSRLTLEHSYRMVRLTLDPEKSRHNNHGFDEFTPHADKYDIKKVRMKIYGREQPRPLTGKGEASPLDTPSGETFYFPDLERLETVLAPLTSTRKIFFLVPFHLYQQPDGRSRGHAIQKACKQRLVEISRNQPDVHVLDFLIASEITTRDTNYWDGGHYTMAVARQMESMMAKAIGEGWEDRRYFHYLAGRSQ